MWWNLSITDSLGIILITEVSLWDSILINQSILISGCIFMKGSTVVTPTFTHVTNLWMWFTPIYLQIISINFREILLSLFY